MSMTDDIGKRAQHLPQTELRLTAVEVLFPKKRPITKFKLVIKINEKEYETEYDRDAPIRWAGEIHCLEGTKIGIHMHRRNRFHRWMKFASVETSLTEKLSPVTVFDYQKRITATLTVTPAYGQDIRSVEVNNSQASMTAKSVDGIRLSGMFAGVGATNDMVFKKIITIDKLRQIRDVLDSLNIGEPLKAIHPAVEKAVAAIDSLSELSNLQKAWREEASDIVDQFMSFISTTTHIEALKNRAETQRAVNVMLEVISRALNYIRESTSDSVRGIIGDLLGSDYKERIGKFREQFTRAKEAFDRSVQLDIYLAVDPIETTVESIFLHEKLSDCKNAYFKRDGGCLDGTRTALLQRVEHWMDNADEAQPNIFWLFGNAGSGKSTVANTVAKMVEDPARGQYLSCFFCQRDDPDLSNPRRLVPTLAYSFAQQHDSYRSAVLRLLHSSRGRGVATTADVKTQFERLFEELLIQTVDPLRPHVVVIDALNECGSVEDQRKLATQILALSRAVPWIKVFVASRDEPAIRHVFSQAPDCVLSSINDKAEVDKDIRMYIDSQAATLDIRLSENDIRKLVELSGGLFIWLRTFFEYLRGDPDANSLLNNLLSSETSGSHSCSSELSSELYELYDKVLDSAMRHQKDGVSFMQAMLAIVNVATPNHPLSAKTIVSFLHSQGLHTQFDNADADTIIKKLRAVLYVNADGTICAHHTSFYRFLEWKADSSSDPGWGTSGATHRLLALSCISTLRKELAFNICKIDIPVLNKDIPDLATRIATHMSEALQYSSRFWFIHLALSTLAAADIMADVLKLLCSMKLLFWLECLSLQGFLRPDVLIFRTNVTKFFQEYPTVIVTTEDIHRFVTSFADAMDSIPHIYMSALFWLPEGSLTYQNLGLSTKKNWHLLNNHKKNWDALVWEVHDNTVQSVVFSPNGRFLAYGGVSVFIRDSKTGALEGELLRGHQDAILSLAFSPDCRFIVSGSEDATVRIWDVKTGEAIFAALQGHSDSVRCVAYSPDGLYIASGSDDCTIRIWNTMTGQSEGKPLLHRNGVNGVAYSPDGRSIVSGCGDRCLHIWDTSSHQEAIEPLQGHQGAVHPVAYSPDGRTIISGSWDNTIRVWDAYTGQQIGEPLRGHTAYVNSVAYSPDGRCILSGSYDKTVRLWEAASHMPIGKPLRAHSRTVNSVSYSSNNSLIASASDDGVRVWDTSICFAADNQFPSQTVNVDTQAVYAVAYSPDGRFIASGSRDSDQIRLWNAQTGAAVDTPVLRHTGMIRGADVQSITYSRDGRFVASGSNDSVNNTVCVLDTQRGDIISGPFRGHSDTISSVAYSPDGRSVASASLDGTVRLWDVQTSTVIGEPLQTDSRVLSVAFSPDGHLLACGTSTGRIWIWHARTRACIRDPIKAHSQLIRSVVFSPDGRHIASASDDHSVRIWDTQTGKASGSLPQGRGDARVFCVAYSPDGRFIASSSASAIIVWDVQGGLPCGELLRGTTGRISTAYSPDGHFLASGGEDGKIYVHHVPNDFDGAEARWVHLCSHMGPQDGWIKNSDTLLLWVPVPYRADVQSGARVIIPNPVPDITAYSMDYMALFRYSGRNWTDIFSGFDG